MKCNLFERASCVLLEPIFERAERYKAKAATADDAEFGKNHRKLTAGQRLEIVLGSLRSERSIDWALPRARDRESLLGRWRDQALEAAAERFESGQERTLQTEQRRRVAPLERAFGRSLRAGERGESIARLGGAPRGAVGSGGV